ncbi:MAG: DUF5666 domain-containing protein [Acidobacteriota bacterium]
MFRRTIVTLSMLGLLAASLMAHEGHNHLMGTITALDGSHVTVKTKEGKTVKVMVNDSTKYHRDSGTASMADLKVGARVVVEAEGKDMLTATKVHFGAVAAKGKKAKAAQSKAVPHQH